MINSCVLVHLQPTFALPGPLPVRPSIASPATPSFSVSSVLLSADELTPSPASRPSFTPSTPTSPMPATPAPCSASMGGPTDPRVLGATPVAPVQAPLAYEPIAVAAAMLDKNVRLHSYQRALPETFYYLPPMPKAELEGRLRAVHVPDTDILKLFEFLHTSQPSVTVSFDAGHIITRFIDSKFLQLIATCP